MKKNSGNRGDFIVVVELRGIVCSLLRHVKFPLSTYVCYITAVVSAHGVRRMPRLPAIKNHAKTVFGNMVCPWIFLKIMSARILYSIPFTFVSTFMRLTF